MTFVISPHMAGTDGGQVQARYVEAMFQKTLEEVGMERFDVYLNYPKQEAGSRRVAIVEPEDLAFEAVIEEDMVYPGDPSKQNTPVFHGLVNFRVFLRVLGLFGDIWHCPKRDLKVVSETDITQNGN